jgi:hypothetical protein
MGFHDCYHGIPALVKRQSLYYQLYIQSPRSVVLRNNGGRWTRISILTAEVLNHSEREILDCIEVEMSYVGM